MYFSRAGTSLARNASPSPTPFLLPRLQAHPHEDYDHDLWFQAYTPAQEDGCYISSPAGELNADGTWDEKTVCWWHMADGAVLGVHDGMRRTAVVSVRL